MVDVSAAIAWLLPRQTTPEAAAFFTDEEARVLVAPFVFEWEVQNVLLAARRGGKLSDEGLRQIRSELADLAIHVADPFAPALVSDLAEARGLSLFDAAYLAMAAELGADLASGDAALLDACRTEGVAAFDFRASR